MIRPEDLPAFIDAHAHCHFVAHNAGFDWRFVSRGLEAQALPAYDVPVLCTRKLGRRIAPEPVSMPREELRAEHWPIRLSGRSKRALTP